MKAFRKQPADHRPITLDLTEWLGDTDTVVSVDVTAPDGIELTGTDIDSPYVRLWIRGGTDGETYKFSPVISGQARVKEVDFLVVVRDR